MLLRCFICSAESLMHRPLCPANFPQSGWHSSHIIANAALVPVISWKRLLFASTGVQARNVNTPGVICNRQSCLDQCACSYSIFHPLGNHVCRKKRLTYSYTTFTPSARISARAIRQSARRKSGGIVTRKATFR